MYEDGPEGKDLEARGLKGGIPSALPMSHPQYGMEMRSESSPVEKSAERNEHDVVIGVSRRHEAVAVVGLQGGAQLSDGSGIGGRRGGHLVEEEESREETGLNE